MDIASEKKLMRADIRERLRLLTPEGIAEQSKLVCERVTAMEEFKAARVILAYMATPRECDPSYIVEAAMALDKQVAFPKCVEGNRLELYIPDEGGMASGAYGIMEPIAGRSRRVYPDDIGFFIIPGVAFDAKCSRLGHGAGYYDRLLCDVDAVTVGIALEEQLVNYVPVGEHDLSLSRVVWRNGIYCK